jgi:hypothetical protein
VKLRRIDGSIRRWWIVQAAAVLVLALLLQPLGGYTAWSAPAFQSTNPIVEYFVDWFPRVARIQSEQPAWISPLVTVNPCLLQQLRYDQLWQSQPHGVTSDNFGANKGLELIPWQDIEVSLGIPAWIAHNGAIQHPTKTSTPPSDGWADETFLIKYRLFSGNAENGNYIVTAFMGFSAPTGNNGNSSGHAIFTPTIAFGKGFGNFDLQSTVGVSLPNGGLKRLGMPVAYNTAFQYHFMKYFWPQFEVNYTWWPNGQREGESQVFLTPGMMVGTIPIHDRIGIAVGAGYQVAVTRQPAYNHSAILSARVPF